MIIRKPCYSAATAGTRSASSAASRRSIEAMMYGEYGPRCRYTANSAASRHKFLQSPRPPFLEFGNGDNFAYDHTDASDKLVSGKEPFVSQLT